MYAAVSFYYAYARRITGRSERRVRDGLAHESSVCGLTLLVYAALRFYYVYARRITGRGRFSRRRVRDGLAHQSQVLSLLALLLQKYTY